MPLPPLTGLAGELALSAVDAARRAGELIVSLARDGAAKSWDKADGSPLTMADLGSNTLLKQALGALHPCLGIISEEDVPDYEQRAAWESLWIIDPLDGTKEFLAGNGEYCVCVALVQDRRPVLGVIYEAHAKTVYLGLVGQGAFRQRGTEPFEPISACRKAQGQRDITLVSRSHADPALESWLDEHGDFARYPLGSALKFCRIAEGAAQHYARLTHIREWDVAAGHALVEAAGARMRTLEGHDILYNSQTLHAPSFLVDIPDDT